MNKFQLSFGKTKDLEQIEKIGIAISNPIRINILTQINEKSKTITELVKLNFVSFSSILFHLKLLEEAGLIRIVEIAGKKTINKGAEYINIDFDPPPEEQHLVSQTYCQEVNIGDYIDASFGNDNGFIIDGETYKFTTNSPFFKERHKACIIWSCQGYLEYAFDNSPFINKNIQDIEFSFEICSETSFYNNTYKSLFGISINGVEVCEYMSPGDFGGRRGKLNSPQISSYATQFGVLVRVNITQEGIFLNSIQINKNITIDSLNISNQKQLTLKITNKMYNNYYGGFNIFGKNCGDFPQDIKMEVIYK